MGLAIVCEGSACCRYNDLICIFCHYQSSDSFINCIVALFCCAIPVDAVCVLGIADCCLASCGCEGRCLAIHEAGDRSGSRQGCAIVYLVRIRCFHGQDCRINLHIRFFHSHYRSVGNFYIYRIFTIICCGYICICRYCTAEVCTIC